jgi:calcineurin-like phosphoesterase family protein
MNTFLTADWHLGENRFELMGRPFTSTEEHNNTILQRHNSVVKPDDVVIVIGDAVYQKTPDFLDMVSKFNGKKVLIRGNHDAVFKDEQLAPYFDKIIAEGEGISASVDGIDCYLTHYPTQGKADKFNLVGHIHAAWKYQLNMFNVGIDTNGYYPVNLNKIPFHFNAIKNFYDDDVWAAYSDINTDYVGVRGKKGSYFKKQT